MIDTKQRILDTAEQLFGAEGYDATSLRHIITQAGVNLAAIHYHFGSKEELLDELILRRAGPVNEKRMALLDQLEAKAGEGPVEIERVLEAFLAPMAEVADRKPEFVRVMGRMHAEGMMPVIVRRHFGLVIERFVGAMRRALPDLPEQELLWRVHFMTGAMAHTMCIPPNLVPITADPAPFRDRIARLIAFLSGGFRAPLPQPEQIEVSQ